MLITANLQLSETLFRPLPALSSQPEPAREIEQAVRNARCRWPALANMVLDAVALMEGNSLYDMIGEPTMQACCLPGTAGQARLIARTATGLSCTCDNWPPAVRAGPGDGLYCAHILALLLQVYLRRPLSPLPYSPEALWQQALDELRRLVTRAAFTSWLAGSRVLLSASTPLRLTVEVPTPYAQEWLAYRLQPVIARTLAGIAGYPLDICFVCTSMRSDNP